MVTGSIAFMSLMIDDIAFLKRAFKGFIARATSLLTDNRGDVHVLCDPTLWGDAPSGNDAVSDEGIGAAFSSMRSVF